MKRRKFLKILVALPIVSILSRIGSEEQPDQDKISIVSVWDNEVISPDCKFFTHNNSITWKHTTFPGLKEYITTGKEYDG